MPFEGKNERTRLEVRGRDGVAKGFATMARQNQCALSNPMSQKGEESKETEAPTNA